MYMFKRFVKLVFAAAIIFSVLPANITTNASDDSDSFIEISAGDTYNLGLKSDGSLWAWGGNTVGQLGDGTNTEQYSPRKIMDGVKAISAGSVHSLAVKNDGSLWVWGGNYNGQLGDGTTTDRNTPVKIIDSGVTAVSAGGWHSLAIKSDGSLWAWGNNYYGQLGDGTSANINITTPIKIMDGVKAINASNEHSFAIKNDGSLWAWGYNQYGKLGDGTTENKSTPVKIMDGVTAVSSRSYHSLAIKNDGSLWAWGTGEYGGLGDGTTTNRSAPVKIMDSGVTAACAGNWQSMAIKDDGSLWSWGYNAWGQIGDGTKINKTTPVKIMDDVAKITMGDFHNIAIKNDGSVWRWGQNSYGQFGDGSPIGSIVPVKVSGGETLEEEKPAATNPPAVVISDTPGAPRVFDDSHLTWDGKSATLKEIAKNLNYDMVYANGDYKPLYANSAQQLWNKGLMLGSDGVFNLDKPLTRAEGIIMTLRILGKEQEALNLKLPCPFTDVPAWAQYQVAYAAQNGIASGYSATVFGSNDPMTANQYITFVLRAMGYNDRNGDFVWSSAAEKALEIGLIGDSCRDQYMRSNLFLRDNVAVISYGALFSAKSKDGSLLGDKITAQMPAGSVPYSTLRIKQEASSNPQPTPQEPAPAPSNNLANYEKHREDMLSIIRAVMSVRTAYESGKRPVSGNGYTVKYKPNGTLDYVDTYSPLKASNTVFDNGAPVFTSPSFFSPEINIFYYPNSSLLQITVEEARRPIFLNPDITQELLDNIKSNLTANSRSAVIYMRNDDGENIGRYIVVNASNYDSAANAGTCIIYNINPDDEEGFGTSSAINLSSY